MPLKHTISPGGKNKGTIYIYVFQDSTDPDQIVVPRKYLYQYLIDNFFQHPIRNRILPKMLPKNGAERALFLQSHPEIVPLDEQRIQETLTPYRPNPQALIQIIVYLVLLETLYRIISLIKTVK